MIKKRIKDHLIVLSLLIGVVFVVPVHSHQGSSTNEPRLVCAEKSLGDACEWRDGHEALYIGSCRKVSSSLLCVRNKPIVYPKDMKHEKVHVHSEG